MGINPQLEGLPLRGERNTKTDFPKVKKNPTELLRLGSFFYRLI